MAVNIEIGADFRKFFEKMDDAAQKVGEAGFAMQKAGLALSLSITTPMLLIAKEAVNASSKLGIVSQDIQDLRNNAIAGLGDEIVDAFNLDENIKEFAEWLKGLIDGFKALNPELKKLIITIFAVVAAIGPLSAYIGTLMTFIPALTAMFVFLATPMGAIVGLLTLIIAGFLALNIAAAAYNKISEDTKTLVDGLKYSYSQLGGQIEKIQTLKDNAKNATAEEIQAIKDETRQIILQTEQLIKQAIARRELLKSKLSDQLAATLQSTRGVGMQGEFIGAEMAGIKKITKEIEQLSTEIESSNLQIYRMYEQMHALDYETKKVAKTIKSVTQPIKEVKEEFKSLVTDLPEQFDSLVSSIEGPAKSLGIALSEGASAYAKHFQQTIQDWSNGVKQLVVSTATDLASFLGDSIGKALAGTMTGKDFGKGLLDNIADFMQKLGSLMVAFGTQMFLFTTNAMIPTPANAAIALGAGLAMIAAGAAIKGYMGSGMDNSSSGYSSSGGGGGFGGVSYNPQPVILETRIEGRELILVQKRTNSFTR